MNILFVNGYGPRGQIQCSILVDTGANDVVFPSALAASLGVSLSAAAVRTAQGVGSSQGIPLFYAPVILQLQDQIEICRWRAVVAFTQAPLRLPLLGIAGGLQYFRTTLDVEARQIEMIAKPSLPRTQGAAP